MFFSVTLITSTDTHHGLIDSRTAVQTQLVPGCFLFHRHAEAMDNPFIRVAASQCIFQGNVLIRQKAGAQLPIRS